MSIFVVTYSYFPEPERLAQVRPERLTFFRRLEAEGTLLASGQLIGSETSDGMLVLRASSADAAEAALDADPYVLEGLVSTRTVTQWHPTVGTWIA